MTPKCCAALIGLVGLHEILSGKIEGRYAVAIPASVKGTSLLPAKAAVLRNQVIAGAPSVAAPSLAIDHVTVRRPADIRALRAMTMVVTGLMIRVASVRVGSTGMRECPLRMRKREEHGK